MAHQQAPHQVLLAGILRDCHSRRNKLTHRATADVINKCLDTTALEMHQHDEVLHLEGAYCIFQRRAGAMIAIPDLARWHKLVRHCAPQMALIDQLLKKTGFFQNSGS